MKILRLIAENIKRLSVVEITPQGNLVIVGGKNSAGKSSTLDSIMYALAGGQTLPEKPVRRGQQKARVELDLGDIVVKRRFTASGGTSLIVTNKEGVKFQSPQAMLDSLTGRLSFDPLEFARQKPAEQARTLKELLGLDFKAKDAERQKLYDERTAINRDVTRIKGTISTMPIPEKDLPTEPVSTAGILEEQADASKKNADNALARQNCLSINRDYKTAVDAAVDAAEAIENLKAEIANAQNALKVKEANLSVLNRAKDEAKKKAEEASAAVEQLKDEVLSGFNKRLQDAERVNARLRERDQRFNLVKELRDTEVKAGKLSNAIDQIDADKRQAIADAKMPVAGLGFDDLGNLTLNGLPFEQAGTREQIAVSVSVGLALNKQLPVLLIRNGSEVDEDGLKLISEMAEKADAQVWLECIRTDGSVSVVIEDGHVKGVEAEAPAEEAQQEQELGITP